MTTVPGLSRGAAGAKTWRVVHDLIARARDSTASGTGARSAAGNGTGNGGDGETRDGNGETRDGNGETREGTTAHSPPQVMDEDVLTSHDFMGRVEISAPNRGGPAKAWHRLTGFKGETAKDLGQVQVTVQWVHDPARAVSPPADDAPRPKNELAIAVARARGLRAADVNLLSAASSDPYLLARCDGAEATSKVVADTCDPVLGRRGKTAFEMHRAGKVAAPPRGAARIFRGVLPDRRSTAFDINERQSSLDGVGPRSSRGGIVAAPRGATRIFRGVLPDKDG